MRTFLFLLLAAVLRAQAPDPIKIQAGATQVRGPGAAPTAMPADSHVIAKVDGETITAARLRDLLQGAPQQAIQAAASDPKGFLSWSYTMRKLGAQGMKEGLDKKSPYKDRLTWGEYQVLMMAMIESRKETAAPEQEAKRQYEQESYLHGTAQVKMIYVAAGANRDAARAKAESLAARARQGAPFGALAKENSDDPASAAKEGDYKVLHPADKFPVEIKKKIFAAKPKEVIGPFEQKAGFYVFQVIAAGAPPFEEAKEKLVEEQRKKKMEEWMDGVRKTVEVKITNPQFFQTLAQQEMAPALGVAPPPPMEIKPETELGIVNGKVLNAEAFTGLLKGVSPQIRTNAIRQPADFLNQYALMQRLTEAAHKEGLDEKQPFKGRLSFNQAEILTQAVVDQYNNEIVIQVDEQKKEYGASPDRFRWAKCRVLYVAFSVSPPPRTDPNSPKILNEDEGRAKAEGIAKQIRAGADFAKMVAQYSDDLQTKSKGGEIPVVSADAPGPEEVKRAIFSAKAGDVLGPLKMPNGFWIIKVDDQGQKSYEQVKDQIYEELRAQRFQKWFDGIRDGFKIEVVDGAAFRQVVGQ